VDKSWYKNGWSMEIKACSWVEDTTREVDFVIDFLRLTGDEQILDLGCGYGRHAFELATRGFSVVGVDITNEYIDYAKLIAKKGNNVEFVCADVRDLDYFEEFDVVLNLCDGVIGYLENDEENEKIFNVVANALSPGGKHLLQVINRAYAEKYFPKRDWDIGKKAISLVDFDWDRDHYRMQYKEYLIHWGKNLHDLLCSIDASVRLYSIHEIQDILKSVGMRFQQCSSSLTSKKVVSQDEMILVVSSIKA